MSGAGPTGVEAAKIVAEYIRLRSTLDEDDAANIIHILHEAGVRFRLPSSNAAEGAGETDALARENHWRKLEGRDPALPKPTASPAAPSSPAPTHLVPDKNSASGYSLQARLAAPPKPALNRLALAEIIHRARFSADRVATSFAEEHGLGREYCFRIADSVLAFIGSSVPVVGETREAIAQFVEKVAASYHGEAVVYSRTNVGNILATTATSIRLLPVPDATVSGKAWPQSIETWNLEKHGRHIIGKGHDFGAAEYCFFDDGGWTVATFNGQIIRRTPEIWWPMIPPSSPQHVGREATVSARDAVIGEVWRHFDNLQDDHEMTVAGIKAEIRSRSLAGAKP